MTEDEMVGRLLDYKGIQPVHPKEINPDLEGLMLKLKLQ